MSSLIFPINGRHGQSTRVICQSPFHIYGHHAPIDHPIYFPYTFRQSNMACWTCSHFYMFFFFKWGHLNWFRYIPISPWHPIRPHFFLVKTKQNYRIPTAISNHVNPMIFWYSHDIPVLIINGNFKILKWGYCTLLYHICGLYKGYVTH